VRPRTHMVLLVEGRELVVKEAGTSSTSTVRDPEHLLGVLEEHFGLRFPNGTRFSRPEF
jgi:hypothetical protein